MVTIGKRAPQDEPLVSYRFRHATMLSGNFGIDVINPDAATSQDIVI